MNAYIIDLLQVELVTEQVLVTTHTMFNTTILGNSMKIQLHSSTAPGLNRGLVCMHEHMLKVDLRV